MPSSTRRSHTGFLVPLQFVYAELTWHPSPVDDRYTQVAQKGIVRQLSGPGRGQTPRRRVMSVVSTGVGVVVSPVRGKQCKGDPCSECVRKGLDCEREDESEKAARKLKAMRPVEATWGLNNTCYQCQANQCLCPESSGPCDVCMRMGVPCLRPHSVGPLPASTGLLPANTPEALTRYGPPVPYTAPSTSTSQAQARLESTAPDIPDPAMSLFPVVPGETQLTVVGGTPVYKNNPTMWASFSTPDARQQLPSPATFSALDRPVDHEQYMRMVRGRFDGDSTRRDMDRLEWQQSVSDLTPQFAGGNPSKEIFPGFDTRHDPVHSLSSFGVANPDLTGSGGTFLEPPLYDLQASYQPVDMASTVRPLQPVEDLSADQYAQWINYEPETTGL